MSTRRLLTMICIPAVGAALTLVCGLPNAHARARHAQTKIDKRRVGIVVSVRVNMTAREARDLSTALGDALRRALAVEIVAGADGTGIAPEPDLDHDCVNRPGCLSRLGRAIGADELLILSLVRIGDAVRIEAVWAEVSEGRPVPRPAIRVDESVDKRAVLERLAGKLLPHLAARAGPEEGGPRRGPRLATSATVPSLESATPARDRRRRWTTGVWISGGLAAGALVGGAVVGTLAKRDFDSLQAGGCATSCPPEALARVSRRALAADILIGAAVASSATALYLYWRGGRSRSRPRLSDRPAIRAHVSARGFGIGVHGRF